MFISEVIDIITDDNNSYSNDSDLEDEKVDSSIIKELL
jgi:hypothetical protein